MSTFLPPLPRFPSFPDCISLLWLLQLLLLSAVTVLPVGGWKLDRLCRHGTDKAEIAGLFTNKIQTSFFAEKALMFLLTAEGFLSNKLGAPGLIYGTGDPPQSLNLWARSWQMFVSACTSTGFCHQLKKLCAEANLLRLVAYWEMCKRGTSRTVCSQTLKFGREISTVLVKCTEAGRNQVGSFVALAQRCWFVWLWALDGKLSCQKPGCSVPWKQIA